MTFQRQVKHSEQQRTNMWKRWKAGQSLHEIGRVFGKDHASIQYMLAQPGGASIKVGEDTIGGVGLSGAPMGGAQEEACAKAGIAKVADQLR